MVTGGKHFSKTFSIFYMLNSKKQSFQPIFFNWYLSNENTAFVDKSSVEPPISFIEKISFSLKLLSGHFNGQSVIKTVRGGFLYNYVSYSLIFGPVINEGVFVYLNCRNIRLLYVL